MYKIYSLRCPITNELVYVGKTQNSLHRRCYEHIRVAKVGRPNTSKRDWILDLLSRGKKPIIELLEICTKKNWRERERYWCDQINPPLNHNTAGGGSDGERVNKSDIAIILDRLGKVSDDALAKEIGRTRKTIAYYRNQLGIPAKLQDRSLPRKKGRKAPNKIEVPQRYAVMLGTIPDYELEKISGISKKRLMKERHKLGIKSYAETTNHTGKFFKGMSHPRWSKYNETTITA